MSLLNYSGELVDAMQAREGLTHAQMVCGLFSLDNVFIALSNFTELDGPSLETLHKAYRQVIGQLVSAYAASVLAPTEGWNALSEEAKIEKMKEYIKRMDENLKILRKKQEGSQ